jgi:parallel beta-helix repeat protein
MIDRIISRLAMVIGITICLLLIVGTQSVAARSYYVSKSGSDSSQGTEAAPFLTIQKASSLAVAGDTIVVKAGTYGEMIEPANNGQPGLPITYQTYPGDNVLIDGTGQNPTVNLRGSSYIVFDGFEVAYGTLNISLRDASHVEVKNSILRDSSQTSALNGRGAAFCIVRNNQVLRAANCGILLEGGAHDNLVEYNTIRDTVSNDGLSLGSTDYPAGTNNVFQYNDSSGSAEDGLDFYSGDYTVIRGNVLHDNNAKGLYLHGGSNCLVENNVVYGNTGNGLYLGTQYGAGENNTLQNNLFYDNARVIIVAKNNTFINNTFVAKESLNRELVQFYAEEEPEAGSGTVFKNNVFYNRTEKIFNFYLISNINITSDNNLFYTTYSVLASKVGANYANLAAWRAATGYDPHSVSANPGFRDSQNNDYSLESGSQAIDAGTDTGAPATDISGNTREVPADIGAYEYQGPGSLAPTVTISNPANGAVVSGRLNILADAGDDLGVTRVEFYIDGELDLTDTAAPYETTWHTTYYTEGNHTITAIAYDDNGNTGTATVTVSVDSNVTALPGNNDVLVKFKAGTTQAAIDALIQQLGLTAKKVLLTRLYKLTSPTGTSSAHMASLLLNRSEVEYAEINIKRGLDGDQEAEATADTTAPANDDQLLASNLSGISAEIPSAQNDAPALDEIAPTAVTRKISNSSANLRGDKLQTAGNMTTSGLTAILSTLALGCLSLARRALVI